MQSNLIFGYLVAAFVIYIVAQNKLPIYAGFFLGA